ncbi:MAG: SWIM zinc finger family protein [Candidatus Micrarchaeia archaeon]
MKVKVESFTKAGVFYIVDKDKRTCTCPYFLKRKICKHIIAVCGGSGFPSTLLKSYLQKAVRRNQIKLALKITDKLLVDDPKTLLRRLPIIVVEDAALCEGFPALVDLLDKFNKGYILTDEDKVFIKKIVKRIAYAKERDCCFLKKMEGEVAVNLSEEAASYIKALKRRRSLGGMKDDLEMLSTLSHVWQKRFSEDEDKWLKFIKSYGKGCKIQEPTAPLSVEDLKELLPAVDFHCSPIGRMLMKEKSLVDSLNFIEGDDYYKVIRWLWDCDSSVNLKKDITTGQVVEWFVDKEKELALWQKWERKVRELQEWWLFQLVKRKQ